MRKSIKIDLATADRQALTTIGCGTMELTRGTGTSKTSVWRWQDRFLADGVPGLLRDKTHRLRISLLSAGVQARVVAATQAAPPSETTHWTSDAMAKYIGISVSSVQRTSRRLDLLWRSGEFLMMKEPLHAAEAETIHEGFW